MAPFTFIIRREDEDGEWNATRVASEEGELPELPTEASTHQMQRKLYSIALNASSGGSVATTFSTISPNVAIYQVSVGGAAAFSGSGGGGGGGGGGGAAAAAEEEKPAEEEKKEEEEEEDEDMGFSLFD